MLLSSLHRLVWMLRNSWQQCDLVWSVGVYPAAAPACRAGFSLLAQEWHVSSFIVSMSESIYSSSEGQGRLLSVASLTSVEESSPLLAILPSDGIKSYDSSDGGARTSQSERLSTIQLLWIMSSVWIGTLLAGLGEQCLPNTAVAFAVSARDEL